MPFADPGGFPLSRFIFGSRFYVPVHCKFAAASKIICERADPVRCLLCFREVRDAAPSEFSASRGRSSGVAPEPAMPGRYEGNRTSFDDS